MTSTTPTAAPGVSVEAIDLLKCLCADHMYPKLKPLLPLLANAAGGGEPVAWKWEVLPDTEQYKRKGNKEGVYLEDPATLGIPMDHPSYRWTKLYTAPPPPVGEPQGVSEAAIEVACLRHTQALFAGLTSHKAMRRALESFAASRPVAGGVSAEPNPLIPWQGTDDSFDGPLPDGTIADLKFRSGEVCCGCKAWNYTWRDRGAPDDIIAYRISATPPSAAITPVVAAPQAAVDAARWIPFAEKMPPEDAALDNPDVTAVRRVLVTNNLSSRDRMGRMSHIWLAMPFESTDGSVVAYTEADTKIHGLTHWLDPMPVAASTTKAGGAS